MPADLLCTSCGKRNGQWLCYFTKYHGFSQQERRRLESLVDAEILCAECKDAKRRKPEFPYHNRLNWLDFKEFCFAYGKDRQKSKLFFLTGKKFWKENILSSRSWKAKIWHLWYFWNGESRLTMRTEMRDLKNAPTTNL